MNLNKQDTILKTAETCFLEKDYTRATIVEIAGRSAVTPSVLYHYYKNKEDLLFSVIGNRFEAINQDLSDHLQGIIDPLSKIKKIIWFHLNYFCRHTDFARLYMFSGLRNREFYLHSSYQKLRKYSSFLIHAILEGIEKKEFRKGLNVVVLRDVALGILDNEVLSSLILGDMEGMPSRADDIMELLLPALVPDSEQLHAVLTKPELIIGAARELFSEKGFEKTTMLDIAKKIGIAEGSVYNYFKNKDDILFKITEEQLKTIDAEFTDLFSITEPGKKLERIIRVFFTSHLADREFLKTYYIQIFFRDRFWDLSTFRKNLEDGYGLRPVLEEGQQTGAFRADISFRALRNLIVGGLGHMVFRWIFIEDTLKGTPHRSDKTGEINDAVSMVLRMVLAV